MRTNIEGTYGKSSVLNEQLYEGPEPTEQEIEHEEVLDNGLNYGELREEFDKALRDLKKKKAIGIDEIQADFWKESG